VSVTTFAKVIQTRLAATLPLPRCKRNAAMMSVVARVIAPAYIILSIAVWRAKEPESADMNYWEIIGQPSQETRLEFGLGLSRGFSGANIPVDFTE
jgi:hypothetical protein